MSIRFFLALVLGAWWSLAAASIAQGDEAVTVVRAGRLHVGDGRVIDNGAVVLKGGKIVAVGKASEVEIPAGARVVRAAAATPGLIDMAADVFGAQRVVEQGTEVVPEGRLLDLVDLHADRMEELAREGVTTIYATTPRDAVLGPRGAALKTAGGDRASRVLDEDGEPKLVLVSGPEAGNQRPFSPEALSVFTRVPLAKMGIVFVARDAFSKAKFWNEARKDGKKPAADPALEILAELLEGRRRLRVEAEEQYEIATAMRLASEFGLRLTLEGAREAWRMTEAIAKSKTPVVFGPLREPERRGRRGGGPLGPTGGRQDRYSSPELLLDAGVTVALTARSNLGDYGLARQAMYAMRYGLEPEEALAAVTSVPARLLGIEDRVGTLEAGKDADLVLWSGAPFAATSRQTGVIVNGQSIPGRVW